MKNLVTAAALAFAGLSLSSTSAYAVLPYTNGDLLLGFRASGGDGAPRDYVVNVGPASQFTGGTGTITIGSIGNIATDLASSGGPLGLFGSTWHSRGDVFWGVVGTDLAGDPANTLYATRARTAPGTQATAWARRSNSTQSASNSVIRAFISGYINSDANAVSPKGTIQATSFANSYASFTAPGVDFGGAFSSVEGDFANGTAGSVLDLFRVTPSAGGGGSQHLGQFTIDNAGVLSFAFDNATLAPTLTTPASNGQSGNPVSIAFSLPETAQSGSVKLIFDNAGPVSTLTLSATNETGAPHSFNINPASPVGANVVSGSAIPDGVYSVTLSYQDSLGNPAATAQASNVTIDGTAPILNTGGVATTGYLDGETLPDLRPSVSVTDFSSTTIQQSPAPGTALVTGPLNVTFTATDALGNVSSQIVSITVAPVTSVTSVIAQKDGPVPGAGVSGSGVPAGATFITFGVPSINDAGVIAYFAKWKAIPATGSGSGIFAGEPEALVVKVGDAVPSIAGATFKSFKDPVINETGAVAFVATIAGGGSTSVDDSVIVTNAFNGSLSLVAREGVTVGGADGATVKSFTNISLQGGEVLFTAKLKGGTPAVLGTNDDAAFAVTQSGQEIVVRESQPFDGSVVKAFKLLGSVSGSPDQARAHASGLATFQVTLLDKRQLLVDGDGVALGAFASTGQPTDGTTLPLATFKSFGFVAADGAQEAVLAGLNANVGGVTSANARGIFLGTGGAFEPVVRLGDAAPGVSGSVFSAFSDPLLVGGAVAFPAKVKDTATKVAVDSLWWKPASSPLTLVGSINTAVPDVAAGAKWKKFTSLGLAGGSNPAPLVYAQLLQGQGGVDATNDYGIWAVDSHGDLRLLVREAETIGGKTLKSITALKGAPTSVGAQHSFNNAGQVIYRAGFTDGSTAIVTTTIP